MTTLFPGELIRRGTPAAPPTLRHAHAGELMRRLGEPLIGGNRVELLEDGPATCAAICRAIEGARDHVNIESCMIEAGGPGEEIVRRLAERCADGVRINLLYGGAPPPSPAFFAPLQRGGVSLCEHRPPQPWRALAGLARQRAPRRLMVVDGRIAFIGAGRRDLHVQVEGPAVQRLQRLFIAHWQRHASAPMQQARYFRPLAPAGTHRVGVVASDAGARRDTYHGALLGAIDTARQRVLLAAACPEPPRRLLRRLVEAARRGVQVELLLPGTSDSWAALHARSHSCVIDGVWASLGASNDWRSLLHDTEADLVVLDEDFAAHLERVLRADPARAGTLDLAAWERRSAWHRLRETVARRFEALL